MKKALLSARCIAILLLLTSNIKAQTPLRVSLGSDQTICYGSYSNLTAHVGSGVAPYTFKWLPSNELNASNTASVVASPTFNTTYKVIVTDAKGNTACGEVTITVAQRPVIIAETYLNTDESGKVKLNAKANGNGKLTYNWRPAASLDNPNTSCPVAKPDNSTTYTLMVRDENGCVATEQITVNMNTAAFANSKEK